MKRPDTRAWIDIAACAVFALLLITIFGPVLL